METPPTDILALITGAGGALVVLSLWVWDLRRERNRERERVIVLTEQYAAAVASGNDKIAELTDAVLDAMDALRHDGLAPAARRRRRVVD